MFFWMYVIFFNFIEKYWQNQFPTTILWSSLIILDHLVYCGIIWNLDIFLETFGYFWDILEICWRSIIRVSSVIIIYIQQICTILTFQYLTKAVFSGLQTIKITFFILYHFPVVSPRCVSPLCLLFLSPRCVSPVCLTVFGSKSSSQPSRLPAKKEQTDGNRWKQNETERNRAIFKIFQAFFTSL